MADLTPVTLESPTVISFDAPGPASEKWKVFVKGDEANGHDIP